MVRLDSLSSCVHVSLQPLKTLLLLMYISLLYSPSYLIQTRLTPPQNQNHLKSRRTIEPLFRPDTLQTLVATASHTHHVLHYANAVTSTRTTHCNALKVPPSGQTFLILRARCLGTESGERLKRSYHYHHDLPTMNPIFGAHDVSRQPDTRGLSSGTIGGRAGLQHEASRMGRC